MSCLTSPNRRQCKMYASKLGAMASLGITAAPPAPAVPPAEAAAAAAAAAAAPAGGSGSAKGLINFKIFKKSLAQLPPHKRAEYEAEHGISQQQGGGASNASNNDSNRQSQKMRFEYKVFVKENHKGGMSFFQPSSNREEAREERGRQREEDREPQEVRVRPKKRPLFQPSMR
mmetsp:Transcript_9053/g.22220  ORF Transcript_9053/g.22220 Transcript_9053/m.22220 type:complete len:173 (-) Transcript_9053:58-576(-)